MRSIRFARSLLFALVLCTLVTLAMPAPSYAQFGVSINIGFAPPALPVYVQPPVPAPGYIWAPGYWAWNPDFGDYYWVPGTWVLAPRIGLLWTPGYWGWVNGAFVWNAGYWGPHIGFYGGVNYGFGYVGVGYAGGYWNNGAFFYNRAVSNVTNVTSVTNVYNKTVVVNNASNVSYNGGSGGITAQPTAQERAAASESHIAPTAEQTQHQQAASTNRMLRASVNQGKPAIAATSKPGVFKGPGVVAAKAAPPFHPVPVSAVAKGAPPRGATPAAGGGRPAAAEMKSVSRPAPTATTPKSAPPPKTTPRPETTTTKSAPAKSTPPPKSTPRPSGEKPKPEPH